MKILAVDDKKTQLEVLTQAIRTAEPNAELHSFTDSGEALEFGSQNICDAAFIDIQMPSVNGIELAKRLKLVHPNINIIFATGYGDYMANAFDLRASGYLMKPITAEKVRRELDNLRHPLPPDMRKRVYFKCFGNFEVFVDNAPLRFRREKSKEVLAYLVDRGTVCSNNEVIAALWPNDVTGSYFRDLRKDLGDTFKNAGCENVMIMQWGKLGVNVSEVSCDYYDWQKGVPTALNAYRGEYMKQYSWAEFTSMK